MLQVDHVSSCHVRSRKVRGCVYGQRSRNIYKCWRTALHATKTLPITFPNWDNPVYTPTCFHPPPPPQLLIQITEERPALPTCLSSLLQTAQLACHVRAETVQSVYIRHVYPFLCILMTDKTNTERISMKFLICTSCSTCREFWLVSA
jgi:hypothetical protein